MPLEIDIPKPEMKSQAEIDMETAREEFNFRVRRIHKDNVTWLESNHYFVNTFIEIGNERTIFNTETNYGRLSIRLYEDGQVDGRLDTQIDFISFMRDEFKVGEGDLQKSYSALIEQVKAIEAEAKTLETNLGNKVKEILPTEVKVEPARYDLDLNFYDEYGMHNLLEVLDSINPFPLDSKYTNLTVEKGDYTAQQVYESFEKAIETIESRM